MIKKYDEKAYATLPSRAKGHLTLNTVRRIKNPSIIIKIYDTGVGSHNE